MLGCGQQGDRRVHSQTDVVRQNLSDDCRAKWDVVENVRARAGQIGDKPRQAAAQRMARQLDGRSSKTAGKTRLLLVVKIQGQLRLSGLGKPQAESPTVEHV